MAHGLNPVLKRPPTAVKGTDGGAKTGIGSRRIFAPIFKLQVLDSYRNDADCKGNQRATARKYGIHRRQIQKWLQCENILRNSVSKIKGAKEQQHQPQQQPTAMPLEARKCGLELALRGSGGRQRDDCCGCLEACGGCAGGQQRQGALKCCSEMVMDTRVPALSPNYPTSPTIASGDHSGHHLTQSATPAPPVVAPAAVPAMAASVATISGGEAPWPAASSSSSSPIRPASLSPLDFTVHSRASPTALSCCQSPVTVDPVAPMDLSFKPLPRHHHHHQQQQQTQAPVYYAPPVPPPSSLQRNMLYPLACAATTSPMSCVDTTAAVCSTTVAVVHQQSSSEVWDLSTKTQKRKHEDENIHTQNSSSPSPLSPKPKPFKLFKPYLDDLHEEGATNNELRDREPVIVKNEAFIPCCNAYIPSESDARYFNNNHILTAEYSYTFPDYSPPKAYHIYPIEESYMYRGECDVPHLCSYDDGPTVLQPVPLKQRQSYSLDFKLSAIECYYQDSLCKGNQRAVANKYNVHRRQVQKWLKQEEELRQKNELFKPIHAVR